MRCCPIHESLNKTNWIFKFTLFFNRLDGSSETEEDFQWRQGQQKHTCYLQTCWSSLSCHFQQPWISSSRFWAIISFHQTPHLSFESVPHLTGIHSSTLRTTDWSDHIPPFDWKPQLLVLSPDSTLEMPRECMFLVLCLITTKIWSDGH